MPFAFIFYCLALVSFLFTVETPNILAKIAGGIIALVCLVLGGLIRWLDD